MPPATPDLQIRAEKTAEFGQVTGPGNTDRTEEASAGNVDLDQPVVLDIILGPERLIDVEMNGRQCVVTRGTKNPSGNSLFLFSEGGDVTFDRDRNPDMESSTTMER